MRLTYELSHKGSGQYDTDNTKDMPINNIWKAINKLGQLEDIEEELGIDLITLFKAIKNGIYVKIYRLIKQARIMNADIKHKTLTYITVEDWNEEWLNFIGYGKTWALTKEELE